MLDVEGNYYSGKWTLGLIHGRGSLKTKSSIYQGNFANMLAHGEGEEEFSNNDFYRGEYQNGKF